MSFDPARIYDVVHPAPVRYLGRRARNPTRVFARLTTPVRLRHVDADVPKPAFVGDLGNFRILDCYALEGALWTHIKRASFSARALGGPSEMDERHLASYLARGGDQDTDLDLAFRRTPVKARVQNFRLSSGDPEAWTRGSDFTDDDKRKIIEDGRETAAARLQEFFAGNVVVAGDKLLVRCGDPVAYFASGISVMAFLRASAPVMTWDMVSPLSLDERGDAVAERSALMSRRFIGGEHPQPAGRGNSDLQVSVERARILDESAFDPLDHAISLAHALPEICVDEGLRLANLQVKHLGGAGGAAFDAAFRAVAARCRVMEAMSLEFAMGGVSAERAGAAMAQALALWDDVGELTAGMPNVANVRWTSRLSDVIECIRSRDLPLLVNALSERTSPDDRDAMSALAV